MPDMDISALLSTNGSDTLRKLALSLFEENSENMPVSLTQKGETVFVLKILLHGRASLAVPHLD